MLASGSPASPCRSDERFREPVSDRTREACLPERNPFTFVSANQSEWQLSLRGRSMWDAESSCISCEREEK